MGYNDPMPQDPEPCECGATPEVYQLDMGIGEASGKCFVQCDDCGSTGLIVMGRGMAVFFWGMKHHRQMAEDHQRVNRKQ